MAPLRLSFILRSTYDLLMKWGKSEDLVQFAMGIREWNMSWAHDGRKIYTSGHNQVLKELAESIQCNATMKNMKLQETEKVFHSTGDARTWLATKKLPAQAMQKSTTQRYSRWRVYCRPSRIDLAPGDHRQNWLEARHLTLLSEGKRDLLIKLTVSCESVNYGDMVRLCGKQGYKPVSSLLRWKLGVS